MESWEKAVGQGDAVAMARLLMERWERDMMLGGLLEPEDLGSWPREWHELGLLRVLAEGARLDATGDREAARRVLGRVPRLLFAGTLKFWPVEQLALVAHCYAIHPEAFWRVATSLDDDGKQELCMRLSEVGAYEAVLMLARTIEQSGTRLGVTMNCAQRMADAGARDKAVRTYSLVLEQFDRSEALSGIWCQSAMAALARLGEFDLAQDFGELDVAWSPLSIGLGELGVALARAGRRDEARVAFQRALELITAHDGASEHPQSMVIWCVLLYAAGFVPQAERCEEVMLSTARGPQARAEVVGRLAGTHQFCGNRERARLFARRYVEALERGDVDMTIGLSRHHTHVCLLLLGELDRARQNLVGADVRFMLLFAPQVVNALLDAHRVNEAIEVVRGYVAPSFLGDAIAGLAGHATLTEGEREQLIALAFTQSFPPPLQTRVVTWTWGVANLLRWQVKNGHLEAADAVVERLPGLRDELRWCIVYAMWEAGNPLWITRAVEAVNEERAALKRALQAEALDMPADVAEEPWPDGAESKLLEQAVAQARHGHAREAWRTVAKLSRTRQAEAMAMVFVELARGLPSAKLRRLYRETREKMSAVAMRKLPASALVRLAEVLAAAQEAKLLLELFSEVPAGSAALVPVALRAAAVVEDPAALARLFADKIASAWKLIGLLGHLYPELAPQLEILPMREEHAGDR
jgi:tetratricopeptide (TPR) repeat protein